MAKINNAFNFYTDTNGDPLENGFIYIGAYGLEPKSNPINIYFDDGFTKNAPNPVRTVNGYASNNTAPTNLFANAEKYSIKVEDANGELVFSNLFVDDSISPSSFNDTVHGNRGGGSLHSAATVSANGFMTTAQVTKLNGIEAGAEVNNISDVNAADLTDGGETTLHSHPVVAGSSVEVFTTSGTFQVPAGITEVYLTGIGSGAGGGGGNDSTNYRGGGGGSAGQYVNMYPITGLTPLDNITVTINDAGTGGAAATDGTDGGDVVFGVHLTIQGGNKGLRGAGAGNGIGGVIPGLGMDGGNGGTGISDNGVAGGGSIYLNGGNGGTASSGGGGGGGGSSPWGQGGSGGNGPGGVGGNATGYGAGGGGGAGEASPGGAGGNGSKGILIISW